MKKTYFFSVILVSALLSFTAVNANAEMPEMAVGAKVSTLGIGGDIVVKATDNINARIGVQGYTYDISGSESGVEYDADLELFSGLLIADWFPFDSGFRISAGVMLNNNEIEATGKANAGISFDIGGTTYTSTQVGELKGKIDYNTFAPYVGIGWGNPVKKDSGWSFFCDLGVAFQGSPDVELTANGTLASNAAFRANLATERRELEDELDDYEYYPVVSVGVTYNF